MSYSNEIGGLQHALSSIGAVGTTHTNTTGTTTKPNNGLPASPELADQTTLSSMGGLVVQALGTSDVRIEKVAKLQQAIASGNYSISSSDVAEKMIDSLLE
jgi:negative regulator of flagellin synthesis FlgM